MKKRLLSLFGVLIVTQFPMACGPIGNDDIFYKIVEIKAMAGKVTSTQPFLLELRDFDLSTHTDTLPASEFGLQIAVDSLVEIAHQPPSSSLLPAAFAAPLEYRPHESSIVELISIYSPDTFYSTDQVHPPGSTLINEFGLVDATGDTLSILAVTENGKLWLQEGTPLNLVIKEEINKVIHQRLTVRLTLADGSEVETTTQKILLKPN